MSKNKDLNKLSVNLKALLKDPQIPEPIKRKMYDLAVDYCWPEDRDELVASVPYAPTEGAV
jgi:hypothetical protein